MTTRECLTCHYNDGYIYYSYPPKIKCTLTNKFRTTDSKCDCEHIIAEMILKTMKGVK